MEQKKIRVAIAGYGNLGKGIECQLEKNPDMELVCVFTRRTPTTVKIKSNAPVVCEKDIELWKDKIDVVFLCGGSANDLPIQGPKYASIFNTIDSFDTHAKALEYSKVMDVATKRGNTIAMSSIGWDPGLFSNMRLLIKSILPNAKIYTFWGAGVSQGHSDAIRRIKGVKDARQYTVPIENAMNRVRSGETPEFKKCEMHERVCYVVAEDGTDKEQIERDIKNMPHYFDEYNTTVHYISYEELLQNHSRLPHGGTVIGVGETTNGTKQVVELKLNLDSNPEFTASVLIAYGRATYKMWRKGERGYKNFSDVPPKFLTDMDYSNVISQVL